MTDQARHIVPYRVVYSGKVRQRLKEISAASRSRGDLPAFILALEEFERRLRLYPQFGEPLKDLSHESGQIWIGLVRPISIRYAVLETRRIVFVATPPVLLPRSTD